MTIKNCVLTGFPLENSQIKPPMGPYIEYETSALGKVKIALPTFLILEQRGNDYFTIAGICKHRTLENKVPLLIDDLFLNQGYKDQNPPFNFEEKIHTFLKTFYELFGKENKKINLNPYQHCTLAYASPEEFLRIIDLLKSEDKVTYGKVHRLTGNINKTFMSFKLTPKGKEEAIKFLPKMPLIGLVNQEIATGSISIDEKINHSKKLFFSYPSTLDNMRSACETLSFVLEPLRNELKDYFSKKDISFFFQLVNEFDIRHNRDKTNNLTEPEQLEWVYYTLLNTINTYFKLKEKNK